MSREEAQHLAFEDYNITTYGYPNPTEEQKRNPPDWMKGTPSGAPAGPPPTAAGAGGAKPSVAKPEPGSGSILDGIPDPSPTFKEAETMTPSSPEEQAQDRAAQEAADDLMSGDKARAERAQKALEFANQETKNRAARIIVRRIQAIVNEAMRAATNAAAGAPRVRN